MRVDQARLTELGLDPGKADGVYGPKPAAGVTAFQAARKIEADGIVGPITRAMLNKDWSLRRRLNSLRYLFLGYTITRIHENKDSRSQGAMNHHHFGLVPYWRRV